MKYSISALCLFLLTSCSSNPTIKGYEKDEVLSTSNDRSQPDWADETKPFEIRSGTVYSVGVTTLRGQERPEVGVRIAENNARANIAKTIQNRMEFIFQNSEENASYDSTQAKFIGSEVSTLTSHSLRSEGAFWKRYAQSDEDGSRHIYYKIYSLVTIPEIDLKKAINDALNPRVAEHKLSPTFQDQVNRQWDRFVESKPNQERAPTQEKEATKTSAPVQEEKPETKK